MKQIREATDALYGGLIAHCMGQRGNSSFGLELLTHGPISEEPTPVHEGRHFVCGRREFLGTQCVFPEVLPFFALPPVGAAACRCISGGISSMWSVTTWYTVSPVCEEVRVSKRPG